MSTAESEMAERLRRAFELHDLGLEIQRQNPGAGLLTGYIVDARLADSGTSAFARKSRPARLTAVVVFRF